ncbi:MAG: multiheme c-type cytochrome [Deferribacteraceae bacterium]|nr:multiheme c-type cytochrome [Deferribacteraceae bacterium]
MFISSNKIPILFCIFLLFCLSKSYSFTGQESAKECAICHYEWMDSFIYELKGTEIVDYQKDRIVANERMCFSCHDGSVADSRLRVWANDMHKVGIKPPSNMKIPNELPLENGEIQCRTCHTAHGTKDINKGDIGRSVFLRVENTNSQLCKMCHSDKKGHYNHPESKLNSKMSVSRQLVENKGKLGDDEKIICESCHTPHGPKGKKILLGKIGNSEICSFCHTDKLDSKKQYKKGVLNHPVNIPTDNTMISEVESLGGKFEDGRIICLSCHNTHKGINKELLIVDNKDDKLCLTCHKNKVSVKNTSHDLKKKKGFKNMFGQTPDKYGTCSACHGPHGWGVNLPNIDTDLLSKACLSCHKEADIVGEKRIFKDRFNHPVSVEVKNSQDLPLFTKSINYFSEMNKENNDKFINCATCHDSHGKEKNFLRAEVKNDFICLKCHDNKKDILGSKHSLNDITCLSCHNIHNSENKYLLKRDIKDICVDCHNKNGVAKQFIPGENSHPVNKIVHDVIPDNFKLYDSKIQCATCHDPHQPGKNKKFLRINFSNKDDFCISCHIEKNGIFNSKHHDQKKKGLCENCHVVHNSFSNKYLMSIKWDYNNDNDYCEVCHNTNGVAKNNIVKVLHPFGTIKDKKNAIKENLSCISCHDPHSQQKGKNRFLKYEEDSFCFQCHKDKKEFLDSPHNSTHFRDMSGKFKKENCYLCHDIHKRGETEDAVLIRTCESCHSDKNIFGNNIIKTSHIGMKDEKIKDFYTHNGEVVCKTCHEPHINNKYLFPSNILKSYQLCISCHQKEKDVLYSEHNMSLIFKDKDSVCDACHTVHNYSENNKYFYKKDVDANKDFVKEICLGCHSENGIAKTKAINIYGHPEIPMTFKLEKDLPNKFLFKKNGEKSLTGNITCATCHDVHKWSESHDYKVTENTEGNVLNSFLKYKGIITFCSTCHGEETMLRYKYYHTDKLRKEKYNDKKKRKKTFMELLIGN